MEKFKIFIDGAQGTTGLRIRERLAGRDDVSLISLPENQRKEMQARLDAVHHADLSILCLPDDAARQIVQSADPQARICDTSTAHRTASGWVYGFPELSRRRETIQSATRVAIPGCHATGFLAIVTPLVELGVLCPDTQLACHSLTGYSGGGKSMIAAYQQPDRPNSYQAPRLYALGMQHKHLPEMKSVAGLSSPPLFTPIVADYYSGMLVSLPLSAQLLRSEAQSPEAVTELLRQYYNGQPLIQVHPSGFAPQDQTISPIDSSGLDSLEIFVNGNKQQLLVSARFDNLGKGASGAAVQCMNLMLGQPETKGLCL